MAEASLNFLHLFQHLPERYILFKANDPDYTFVEASDSHLHMTGVSREKLIGSNFFDIFPDTSDSFKQTGESELLNVFRKVIKDKQTVPLKAFRYDIPDKNGAMQLRYWEPIHHPIFDDKGNVAYILQVSKDVTDELETEKRLTAAERTLERALSAGTLGAWNWDIANDSITGDSNLAHFFGVTPEQAEQGLPLSIFTKSMHPDDRDRITARISETITARGNFEEDYRTIRADGSEGWVSARGSVEVDEHGNPTYFPGILIDITERKAAQNELELSVERFQALADSMPQLVWVTRPDGYHEYYNKAWYDYTGTEYEQVKGAGWNGAFHPDDRARAAKIWKHSLKTGKPYEIEYRLRYKDGTYRWFVGRALPYKNKDGKIEKWYGTCTYIDAQRRAADRQQFLSQASKIVSSTLDHKKSFKHIAKLLTQDISDWCSIDMVQGNAVQSIALKHRDGKKLAIAKELRALQQQTKDRLLQDQLPQFHERITPDMINTSTESDRVKTLVRELNFTSVIKVALTEDGVTVGTMTVANAELNRSFDDNDYKLIQELSTRMSIMLTNAKLYKNAQDELKARKKLELELVDANSSLENKVAERTQELETTNTELSRSNQELQNFAYVASHDLQEPLRKIQAFGDILESEYSSELGDGSDYLKRMQAAASRMSTLINDLLAFSRVATQVKPFISVDLNDVLQNVLEDLYTRIETTNGRVSANTLPTIQGDEVQMRQLLQNLIGNALKFHKPDQPPAVTVTAKKYRSFHKISIKDNGIGFDEKYTDRIFSVFQRLHGREDYEGTGIGLAVCRKIVERHNGTITAKSTPGSGAEFIIKLPING